jgi:general secretion pathway protein G
MLYPGGPRRDSARLGIANIHHALRLYSVKTGRVPTTEEGIQPLVNSGVIEAFPRDPWGNPYRYELRDGQPFVWSLGADGAPGGEGADADIFGPERK